VENKMRDFLRGCLVWFVGYPLSVIVATVVITAPVWALSHSPFDDGVRMVLGAAPVVGFFALLPALLTPPSPRVWSFVAAGTRTGAWCGLLAMSMFVVAFVAVILRVAIEMLVHGHSSPEMPGGLFVTLGWIVGAIAVSAVAGATGGFVFGLVAAVPAQGEALAPSS
jgi:hypothetical protein